MFFYIEIKKAVGGLDSSIFAEELFKLYSSAIKTYHILHITKDKLGIREISLLCHNTDIKYFINEEGTHRVQRIPQTESNGRIQTSTCVVNVYEATKKETTNISNKDIRTDTFRSSGAGGQHVNKTNSAVRLTHLPSKLSCVCQAERSQALNKKQAMRMLIAKLAHHYHQTTSRHKHAKRSDGIFYVHGETFYLSNKRMKTNKDILLYISDKLSALIRSFKI